MKLNKIVEIISVIALALFQIVFKVSIMLTFGGFSLVFINANIEYFQKLPSIILLAIPIGIIGIMIEIFCRNWSASKLNLRRER